MARTFSDVFNEGQLQKLANAAQASRLGTILRGGRRFVKGTVTNGILSLPLTARAAHVLSARVTAGTTLGPKTPVVPAATASGVPATTNVTLSPEGHISFNVATDAPSAAEVEYIAEQGAVYTEILPVASNSATPLAGRNVKRLLAATSLAGTLTGALVVDQRGTAPATGHAAAKQDGTGFSFANADAITSVTVTYIATPGVGTELGDVVSGLDNAASGTL